LRKLLWVVPLLMLAALVYLVASALTSPPPPPPTPPVAQNSGFPLTIKESGGRTVVIPKMPQRIIATNAGMADLLVEIVHIDRIAALPSTVHEFGGAAMWYRNHPEVTTFEKASAENLLALQPDLILWSGFQEETAVNVLEKQGVSVLRFDFYRTVADIRQTIETVGRAVGEPGRAELLLARFDARLAEVEKRVANLPRPRVLSYSNYGTGFAAGLNESYDEILRLSGAKNVSEETGKTGNYQISFEQILQLNPDWLVVVGDAGLNSPQAQIVLNEPALANLPAIQQKRIAVVPDRYYSNINHFIATAIEILARQFHPDAFPKNSPMEKVPPGHL
jgi:iron complex transport system substrate-binding protein